MTSAAERAIALQRNPLRGCKDMDTEWFFPPKGNRKITGHNAQAMQACGRCPLRTECLDIALDMGGVGFQFGIWGGTNARQRAAMARRRAGKGAA